jgi:hypothetical protein
MKSGFNARLTRFDFAGDIFADSPLRMESDKRGVGLLAILRLQRRL